MARLNKKLIHKKALALGKVDGIRPFMHFMGWNSPSKAARVYNATGKPDIDTVEEVAFKLGIPLNELLIPELGKHWPENKS